MSTTTIHAYTESGATYPAYVNLSEHDGAFTLTVRSLDTDDGRASGITMTREQLMNLINDAAEYLDGDLVTTDKVIGQAGSATIGYAADPAYLRHQALDMALRTSVPGTASEKGIVAAAKLYEQYLKGE